VTALKEVISPEINSKLGVAIPTINSAAYIDLILGYYAAVGLPVTVFVDRKTTDRTLSICKSLAKHVAEIMNPTWRVEYALPDISQRLGTPWILRLDDDELPSLQMLKFVAQVIRENSADVVGFPRYQCDVSRTGDMFFHRLHDPFNIHRQWRLYRPDRIRYVSDLHTPGFVWGDGVVSIAAPANAAMIHLDWAVHSFAERAKKLERYDADTPGMGSKFRHYYLADERLDYRAGFAPLAAPEFADVGHQLAARFPKATISPEAVSRTTSI
jgi:glycosyltransferase involved in cell wall biosynthesis